MASNYRCYPFLTKEEFTEACHYFDARYCRATLGPLRTQWQLRIRTALDISPYSDGGLVTYVQIITPLKTYQDNEVDNQLASCLSNFSLGESPVADDTLMSVEEADAEVVRYPSRLDSRKADGVVEYEIHLHPVYQVPCLWFSLHNMPFDESPLDIDSVFRHLVPKDFKHQIRSNPIGGISIDATSSHHGRADILRPPV
ncbi:hypothetical protein NPX13_g6590 [Xylaria arbuscula]|uniref:Autophagy-related protein 10 n=1 Tax=Xylaria arbuscula TaxID=114810 RepID=A0A9W8NC70_9PEZI|nr:hypothetical protein NPX13_g6590 [Xylaria arbuscula]